MTKIVFGAGATLFNNWKYIKKYYNPEYASDNNSLKWFKTDEKTGLVCIPPDTIGTHNDAEVLITVGDPYVSAEIGKQLKSGGISFYYLSDKIDEWSKAEELPNELNMSAHDKKVILFNTPEHDNVGDHLIALSEIIIIKDLLPEYSFYEISDMDYLWNKYKLKALINKDDVLIITGGGFLGSMWLYNCELNVREIVENYPDNRIIIFPQTVFFSEDDRGKREYNISREILRTHRNITVCAREKQSESLCRELIGDNSNVFLLPDMALFFKYDNLVVERNKNVISVCLRNDQESIFDEEEKNRITLATSKKNYVVRHMSMHSGIFEGKTERLQQVMDKFDIIASSGLIITDTLHCMIFAALSGTPCIAFNNLSKKVENVYEWISNLNYIEFCDNEDTLDELIDKHIGNYGEFILQDKEKYLNLLCNILRNKDE